METRLLNASMKVRAMGLDPTCARVRTEFISQQKAELNHKPFWKLYTDYLETKPIKPATRQKANVHKRMLENYCSWSGYCFDITTWDQLEFGRFIQYLIFQQHMADSTINRLVVGVKTFLRYAYPEKNLDFMKYNPIYTEEEVIALTEGELRQLIDADLGGYLEKARDLFVFLATTGMRFSDSQVFNPSWVTEEEILEFNQMKTGGKAYPPLYEASRRVLVKWGGIPPQISNQKFNEHLKELFQELEMDRPVVTTIVRNKQVYRQVHPLSSVISSHTARRTFITLCLEKGMAIQNVMRMSGHSDYKAMRPYIKVTRKFLRTEADKWNI